MEIIHPAHVTRRPPMAPLIAGTVIGTVLIVLGIVIAYVAFATPALRSLLPEGRPNLGQLTTGVILWAIALVGPAMFVLLGANRLVCILRALRRRMPRPSATIKALEGIGDDIVVASGITLPDGRPISDVVIGPFGAAVIRELPPPGMTRIRNGRWEVRTTPGWVMFESPLERASRDAERVRRWLGHDDADFVVKVYAAVVGIEGSVERARDCAVLMPEQVVPWINALPPQRSLTPGRREQVVEAVRAAAR